MKTKNLRKENAITLVALIITIIVLLILAMVSIRLVMNGGIIDRAEKGTKAYSEAEVQEQIKLAHSEFEMQKYGANPETDEATFLHSKLDPLYGAANVEITGTDPLMVTVKNAGNTYAIKVASNGSTEQVEWIQDKTIVKNTKTGQTLEVGDTVFYNSGVEAYEGTGDNQGKWGILGVENGNLLIMSKENVGTVSLQGKQDWLTEGTTKLNNACTAFKNATYADAARSVKVEDINKVTGYIPPEPVEYTYTMVSGKVKRDYPSNKTRFEDVYSNILSTSNSISVISNYYSYGLINYLQSESKSYNLLSDKNSAYWINSLEIDSENNCAWWAIRILRDDNFSGEILWDSNDGIGNSTAGVRSIVSLKSNVKLVGNGTTGYTLQVN